MKHIQQFVLFEAKSARLSSGLTSEQKDFLDLYTDGTWSVNPRTGLVDICGSFGCSNRDLENFADIKFGDVQQNFDCSDNMLISLEGSPRSVGRSFSCARNFLTSSDGCPQIVLRDFFCNENDLSSIEGSPRMIGHDFWCNYNKLVTLQGGPEIVGGDFECEKNLLTTLEGAPKTIPGDFYCYRNKLKSLKGAPNKVEGNFSCYGNQLESLEGAPQSINRLFESDEFTLESGYWNREGWDKVIESGSEKAKELIFTLPDFNPAYWNSKISENPKKTIIELSEIWEKMPDKVRNSIRMTPDLRDDLENLVDLIRKGIL